jgi:hypothetical protein
LFRATHSECGSEGFTVKQVVEQHISKLSIPSFIGFEAVKDCFFKKNVD